MGIRWGAGDSADLKVGGTEPQAVQVVIFDCDGVMFDTAGVNRAYYNRLLSQFGLPAMSDLQFEYVHMHTVDEAVAHLFADEQTRKAAHAFRATLDYRPFLDHLVIEPGLKPLLRRLRTVCKTAVATNRTDTMNSLLSAYGLADSFDMVVRACDVANPKPHPEPLQRILDALGLSPGEAVYVGDSRLDELAASAAGIPFIAYRNPELHALRHIRHLSEMEALFDL
jgi:HAD superfamily hydrolase (TIGR01509 family)